MIIPLSFIWLFVIIVALVCVFAFFMWGVKHAIVLAVNSVIGFFALYAVKAYVWDALLINWLSVGLVALLGIFGFAIVLLLHGFGWYF